MKQRPQFSDWHGQLIVGTRTAHIFRQLCQLRKSVSPPIIFREFAKRPWLHTWWLRVLGFMHRLSEMPEGSLRLDILKDNFADALQQSHCTNWAKGITKHFL